MRRLLRWAFNSAAAVSAVLLVITCVLSVRSYCAMGYGTYHSLHPTGLTASQLNNLMSERGWITFGSMS
jgi:hypothetical protein